MKDCLKLHQERTADKKAKKRKMNTIRKTDLYTFPFSNPACVFRDCIHVENCENDPAIKVLTLTNGYCPGTYNIPFLGMVDAGLLVDTSVDFITNMHYFLMYFRYSMIRLTINQFTDTKDEIAKVHNNYVNSTTLDPSSFFYVDVSEYLDNNILRILLESMGGIFCKSAKDSYYLFVRHSPIRTYMPSFIFPLENEPVDDKVIFKLCPDMKHFLKYEIPTQDFFDDILHVSCTAFPHFEPLSLVPGCFVLMTADQVEQCLPIFTQNGAQLADVTLYEEESEFPTEPLKFKFYFNYLNSDHVIQLVRENNLPCRSIDSDGIDKQ